MPRKGLMWALEEIFRNRICLIQLTKFRVAYGLGVGYTFSKHFGAGIDLLFSKQGVGYKGNVIAGADHATLYHEFDTLANRNGTGFNSTYTADVALSTMKIPIMLRYTGNCTKKIFFNSFIGPQINMLSKVAIKVNDKDANFTGMGVSANDLYKKMTMDLVLGLGAGMNLNENLLLNAGIRIDYGMGDVENKSVTFTSNSGTQKIYDPARATTNNITGGVWISLSYKFVKKAPAKPDPKAKPGAKPAPKKK
jgi:Outer membrane protein beta-barrel domain